MAIDTRDAGDGVRILALNRPPANTLNADVIEEVGAACAEAERDDAVRAVVLTGAGKFFSGGLDLKQVGGDAEQRARVMNLGRDDGIFTLWRMTKPTVAMVNGHAIAGGAILALSCDFRIAARGAGKIGLNEVAIGLAFPIGAYEISRSSLTPQQARKVFLEAGLYPLEAAVELGLVDEAVDAEKLEAVCVERARRLGAYPRNAYAHAKRALQSAAFERIRNESVDERASVHAVWNSEETLRRLAEQLAGIGKK